MEALCAVVSVDFAWLVVDARQGAVLDLISKTRVGFACQYTPVVGLHDKILVDTRLYIQRYVLPFTCIGECAFNTSSSKRRLVFSVDVSIALRSSNALNIR